MRKFYIILAIFSLALIFAYSCTFSNSPTNPSDLPNNGFETAQVAKIFADNCSLSGCHAGDSPINGFSTESQPQLLNGSSNRPGGGANYGGQDLVPFNSEKSLIYQMITGTAEPQMPYRRTALTKGQIEIIKNWIDDGAKDNNDNVPFSNSSYRVYVCNQASDDISVIDGSENVVSRSVDVSVSATNDAPHMVKEFGDFYYVTLISAGKFLKIRKSDNQIAGEVDGLEIPGMIQIHSSGTKAYVSRSASGVGDYNGIYVIDIQNMTLIKEIPFTIGGVPHAMVLHPDPVIAKLYVANLTKNYIHVVNTITDVVDNFYQLTGDQQPMELAISPDGSYLYISARGTSQILMWDTRVQQTIFSVDVNPLPMHIAVNSIGTKIYVASLGGNVVEVINQTSETTWTRTNQISHPSFSQLHGCDITADDRFLYVSSRNLNGNFKPAYPVDSIDVGNVGIIDLNTESVIKLIEIEEYGAGLVVEK